jgi:hypothetical protein
MLFWLRTWPERVNEGTLEVDACNAGSSGAEGRSSIDGIRDVYKCPCDFCLTVRDGGCEQGCSPAFRVCPADGAKGIGRGIHGVCTATAMDMDINKAGKQHIRINWDSVMRGVTTDMGDDAIRDTNRHARKDALWGYRKCGIQGCHR